MYWLINHANGYIEEKGVSKYLIYDSKDENKDLLKNTIMFRVELKTKSKQQMAIKKMIMKKIK